MDLITPAAQAGAGILAALLVTALWRRRLGALGGIIVGLVGGAWAGLIAGAYMDLAPAGMGNVISGPTAFAAHAAIGAAGGALLAVITGVLVGLAER
jgi:hypothetical protein